MTIVWRGGVPVLLDDRIHSWSDGVSTTLGAVHSYSQWLTDSGGGVNIHPDHVYAEQPAVRTVVDFLADNVGQISTHTFLRDGDDRVRTRTTPLARLMAKPSPYATAYSFRAARVLDICLWDRFCALIIRTGATTWQLRRVPPRLWAFERNAFDEPVAIRFADDRVESLERCLWNDGYPSPLDRTPMQCIQDILTEEGESAATRRDLWKNRARIDQYVTRPYEAGDWTPDARDNFKTSWAAYRASGSKTGMMPVLEDGMKLESADRITPLESQQIEARQLSRKDVASFFQVAPELVGAGDATNSNLETKRESLYVDTLGRWFTMFDQADNDRLAPIVAPGTGEFIESNVSGKLRLAFESQMSIYARAAGGPYMTRNEVRQRQNLPAIDGADELIQPLNVTTIDDQQDAATTGAQRTSQGEVF